MNATCRLSLLLATMGVASTARAEVELDPGVEVGGVAFSRLDYAVSERFQRAWLVLHYADRGPCAASEGVCGSDYPVRVHVPGLTFDAATRQVRFREDGAGAPVTCARVVHHRLIHGGESVEPTGACVYHVVKRRGVVDDGFEGREVRREAILFGARP